MKSGLKLSDDAETRLEQLRLLSVRASRDPGDKEARQELRDSVRTSSPAIIAEVSDIAQIGQQLVIQSVARDDPLMEEGLKARRDMLRLELLGESPTVLEAMLVERIIAAWVVGEFFEAIMCGQLQRNIKQGSPSYLKFLLGWQEQAHRRLLSATKALATVRRLSSGIPTSQTNLQVNILEGRGKE